MYDVHDSADEADIVRVVKELPENLYWNN